MNHNVIAQGSIAAGASQSGSLAQQDVNGILISAAGAATLTWNAADYVTVTLKSSLHPQEVLVNRVSAIALAHISDLENGQSIGLQDVLAALTTTDFSSIAFCVPLGCLKNVACDSELEVRFESGATKTVSVSAYFDDDDSDYMVKSLETTVCGMLRPTSSRCICIVPLRTSLTGRRLSCRFSLRAVVARRSATRWTHLRTRRFSVRLRLRGLGVC